MTEKKNINPSAHPSKDPIKKIFFSQDLIPSCNFAAAAFIKHTMVGGFKSFRAVVD